MFEHQQLRVDNLAFRLPELVKYCFMFYYTKCILIMGFCRWL